LKNRIGRLCPRGRVHTQKLSQEPAP
jgi:hypothetical protein